jgi:hypothetical protein
LRRKAALLSVAFVVVLMVGIAVFALGMLGNGNPKDRISLPQGVALCTHFGADNRPYLSATIDVNASSPLKLISAYVNGTFEGSAEYTYGRSIYTTSFSVNPTSTIIAGAHYVVVLTASFQDGASYSANDLVVSC